MAQLFRAQTNLAAAAATPIAQLFRAQTWFGFYGSQLGLWGSFSGSWFTHKPNSI